MDSSNHVAEESPKSEPTLPTAPSETGLAPPRAVLSKRKSESLNLTMHKVVSALHDGQGDVAVQCLDLLKMQCKLWNVKEYKTVLTIKVDLSK